MSFQVTDGPIGQLIENRFDQWDQLGQQSLMANSDLYSVVLYNILSNIYF